MEATPVIALTTPGVVDIARDGVQLSLERGFLLLSFDGEATARIALDDIHALIMSSHQGMLSLNLLRSLSAMGIPIVICGKNHIPEAMFISPTSYRRVSAVVKTQIGASLPLKKKLWQKIIRTKIRHQAQALALVNPQSSYITTLNSLAEQVLSGDSQNHEARAARIYWRALMGKDFVRDHDQPGINAALNYGYAIVRASVARSITGHGLIPMLGLFHSNQNNPWLLADDIMEVWRPVVDLAITQLFPLPNDELTPLAKQEMVKILQWDCQSERGTTPVFNAIDIMMKSLVDSYQNKCDKLIVPQAFGEIHDIRKRIPNDVVDGDV